ncbi:MAG TPA: nicotinate phosphoribosyltransferase [Gemmatimonadales bacterium]|nr:nicotinate phosphoribosyltransferase [Gemmatimonadales bacterium]
MSAFTSGPVALRDAALFTDLYELTMAASYWREGMAGEATFSLFSRRLPATRSFLVAAGLEDALEYLRAFRFSERALAYLATLGCFDPAFLSFLSTVRFTGEVHAVAEGTPMFADEPLLEVTAPIIEAQLVETAVLNCVHAQTVVTSKAARCVLAARGRAVVEFGLRRTPGLDAGMKAVRSAYIAGATSSSNVLAGLEYGVPPTGTMAHSYVCAFPREIDAFRAFARAFPDRTILLLDTYDTVTGAHQAVTVARELAADGHRLAGVRLDSGDLLALSREVRAVLDAGGCTDARIFASGGLDEDEIARCVDAGAPIDAYGVGTRMDVSADAPYLDMAYKLVRYDGRDVLKTSPGKTTWAGPKQVYRLRGPSGRPVEDIIALRDEPAPGGAEPLLATVMRAGELTRPHPSLDAIRDHCAAAVRSLDATVTRLRDAASYPVGFSGRLVAHQRELEARATPSRPPTA